jgi:hypothetical protein
MSDSTAHSYSNQGGRLSAILKAHGAGFVLVRSPGSTYRDWRTGEQRTAKGKEPLGAGWQRHPKTLADAGKWARGGGNVGLLGGHNNLILLDADAGADQVLKPLSHGCARRCASSGAMHPIGPSGSCASSATLPPSKKAHGVHRGAGGWHAGRHRRHARDWRSHRVRRRPDRHAHRR